MCISIFSQLCWKIFRTGETYIHIVGHIPWEFSSPQAQFHVATLHLLLAPISNFQRKRSFENIRIDSHQPKGFASTGDGCHIHRLENLLSARAKQVIKIEKNNIICFYLCTVTVIVPRNTLDSGNVQSYLIDFSWKTSLEGACFSHTPLVSYNLKSSPYSLVIY